MTKYPTLGPVQRQALRRLVRSRQREALGINDQRVLDSLVRRGLAVLNDGVYHPTPEGVRERSRAVVYDCDLCFKTCYAIWHRPEGDICSECVRVFDEESVA
jgi:hypothetical protein